MTWKAEIPRFLRFASLGAIGTLAHCGILVGAVEFLGFDPVAASAIGFLAGAGVNYSLTRAFVFETTQPHHVVFTKFLLVAVSGVLITAAAMHLLVAVLGLNYLASQVLVTGVLVLWHYGLNRIWSFRR